MRSPIAEELNLSVSSVAPRERLLAMLIITAECEHRHRELGFAGCGSWQAYRADNIAGRRPTWQKYLKDNAGISARGWRIYLQCGRVLRTRIEAAAGDGKAEALALLAAKPSALTAAERDALGKLLSSVLREGETQTMLRREFRRTKAPGQAAPAPAPAPGGPAAPGLPAIGGDELLSMAAAAGYAGMLQGGLVDMAAEISGMAMAVGYGRAEADRLAALILLDQGKGIFPTPEPPSTPES